MSASLTLCQKCVRRLACFGLAALVGLGHGVSAASDLDQFATADGRLRQQLRMLDVQHGYVGETGTAWVIEPTGDFSVSPLINQKVGQPRREGKLTSDQLESVVQVLADANFADLPARLGRNVPTNARVISVAFGDDQTSLSLPPRPSIEVDRLVAEGAAASEIEADFLAIVETVQDLTAPD